MVRRNDLKKWVIFSLGVLWVICFQSPVYAGTWSQTTQAEFEANTLSNIDIVKNSGDVRLSGQYTSDSNTVLLLHMNESSWNGTADEVKDSSSYGNHGVRSGDVTTTANGKYGRAGTFDGTTGNYINCGHDTSLDMTSALTLEAWVKTEEKGDIIDKWEGAGDNRSYGMTLWPNTGKLFADLGKDGTNVGYAAIHGSTDLRDNKWHHVAAVFSRPNLNLYVDGVSNATTVSWDNDIYVTTVDVVIGKSGQSAYFNGLMDEVRISNKARSLDEMITNDSDFFASGAITSPAINRGENVTNICLNWDEIRPAGTSITYSATNNGGSNWYELPGDNVLFTFPSSGTDLRVKAELRTGSGTPILHAWSAEYSGDPYGAVYDAITGQANTTSTRKKANTTL